MGAGKRGGVRGGAWEGQKTAVVAMTTCEQKGLEGLVACYMWFRKFFATLYRKAAEHCSYICSLQGLFFSLGFFCMKRGNVASAKLQGQLMLVAIAGEAAL